MGIRGESAPWPPLTKNWRRLERDIRQLKIEYDMYFGGGRKRPPTEIEWRIELLVKRYGERGGELKYGQRFRFNNLSQTYAKYKDMFRKRLAQREEGKVQRHFGAAAKAIEAERAQAPASRTNAEPAAVRRRKRRRFAWSAPNRRKKPRRSTSSTRLFCKRKQACRRGDRQTDALRVQRIRAQEDQRPADKKNCRDVEYVVEVVDGQVKLKALVKS